MKEEIIALAGKIFNEALGLVNNGDFNKAIKKYKEVIKILPNCVAAWNNLANLYIRLDDFYQARECIFKAKVLMPDDIDIICNIGIIEGWIAQIEGRLEERLKISESCFREVLKRVPNHVQANLNLGNALYLKGDLEGAISAFNKAEKEKSLLVEIIYNRSMAKLKQGNFEEGFAEYEARLKMSDNHFYLRFSNIAFWQGEQGKNKVILVQNEQGFGDDLQFIRYILLLRNKFSKVIFFCKKEMVRLIEKGDFADIVLEDNEQNGLKILNGTIHADYQVFLMSLPFYFKTNLYNVPCAEQYFKIPLKARASWQTKRVAEKLLHVGIVWAGSGRNKAKYRDTFLKDWNFIEKMSACGVQFYSLQTGEAKKELTQVSFQETIIDWSDLIVDFYDTACAISCLDLVISVDTATVHLAGAMGKKTFLILPKMREWRWLLEGETTVWYKSLTLITQDNFQNWYSVFRQIEYFLKGILKNVLQGIRMKIQAREFQKQEEYKKAEEYYNKAMKLLPNAKADIELMNNLSLLNRMQGNIDLAALFIKEINEIYPQDVALKWNCARIELAQGDFKSGFKKFMIRTRMPFWQVPHPWLKNMDNTWAGELFNNKKLLVLNEMGLGDMLQFVRFLPQVKARGGKVVLSVYPTLMRLFSNLEGIDEIILHQEKIIKNTYFDYSVLLLTLPYILGFNGKWQSKVPYLKASKESSEKWAEKIVINSTGKRKKVGIAWQCGKYGSEPFRTCPFVSFRSILSIGKKREVQFWNLQKENEIDWSEHENVVDMMKLVCDMDDTAAIVENMDLVITVDTSIAHLAGALGKEVWLMLPFVPDWRWGWGTNKSIWYTKMSIYRARKMNVWEDVVQKICLDLEAWLAGG